MHCIKFSRVEYCTNEKSLLRQLVAAFLQKMGSAKSESPW